MDSPRSRTAPTATSGSRPSTATTIGRIHDARVDQLRRSRRPANVITPSAGLTGIAAGPDNALWFTENAAGQIGRIDTAGVITEYALVSGAKPFGIILGPNGNLWFTDQGTDSIGEITPAGVVLPEFPLSTPNTVPASITLGADGNLYFTVQSLGSSGVQSEIDQITPTGSISPSSSNSPSTAAPNRSRS